MRNRFTHPLNTLDPGRVHVRRSSNSIGDALFAELRTRDISNTTHLWHSTDAPGRRRMIKNNETPTEVLFAEFMETREHPAMTWRQIKTALSGNEDTLTEGISDPQLTKLLQKVARQPFRMRINGRPESPWVFDLEIMNDQEAIKRSVLAAGFTKAPGS